MAHKGSKLEALIVAASAILESRGVAKLHRWPVPMRIVNKPSQCQCGAWSSHPEVTWTGPTGSDFFGVTRAGRGILVEAKSLARPRLPLGTTSGGVTKHQLLELLDWHRAGALALVVWHFEDRIAVFDPDLFMRAGEIQKSVPWSSIPERLTKPLTIDVEDLFEPYLTVKERCAARG